MRKLYFILFGLVLLLAGFADAQAANPFEVKGTITAIDYGAKTLIVDSTITVYATKNTVVAFGQDTLTYTFDDLKTTFYVKIQAIISDSIIAKKICVPYSSVPK